MRNEIKRELLLLISPSVSLSVYPSIDPKNNMHPMSKCGDRGPRLAFSNFYGLAKYTCRVKRLVIFHDFLPC